MVFAPWVYPADRYYYGWYDQPILWPEPTDSDIKAAVVDRLRQNPHTADCDIRVDVKQHVVILGSATWRPSGSGIPESRSRR